MSKTLSRLLRIALVTAGAIVLLLIAVRLLVPAPRLARLIAERIEKATGATVGFAGAQVEVWPRLRLVLEDGAVVGSGRALATRTGLATDVETYVARIGRLEVSLAWAPLLKRRLEVGRVRLVAPHIEIETRSTPPASPRAAPPPGGGAAVAGSGGLPAALIVAGLTVEDGRLDWSDLATGRSLQVEGWQQEVSIGDASLLLRRLEAFAGRAPAPAAGGESSGLDVRSRATLRLSDGDAPAARLWRDLDLTVRLEIPPAVDRLQLRLRHLTWGGVTVTGSGVVSASPLKARLSGEWRLVDLDVEALRRSLPDLAPDLPPATAAWLAQTPLALEEAAARGTIDLPWPLPPAPRYRDLADGLVLEAQVRGLEVVPPRQSAPWRASAALRLAGAEAGLTDLRIDILDGHLSGEARIGDLDRERALCSFAVDGADVPVRALLDAVAPAATPYLEGRADLKLAGAVPLGPPAEMRDALDLAGDLALRDGVVHATSWLDDISPYLGERQDLMNIRYRHLVQHLLVRDGKLYVRDLMLDGRDTDWRGDGWLGLDGDIDMHLTVKFPADFQPRLGELTPLAEALRGEDGRIALALDLRGRASSPGVSLDLTPAKGALHEKLEEDVKGFLDKLRDNK